MLKKYLPDALWAKILVCGAYILLGAGLFWAAGKLLPAIAPFILAALIAWAIARPIRWIAEHTHIPRTVVAVAVCAVVIGAVSVAVFFAADRLIAGAGSAVKYLDAGAANIGDTIGDFADKLRERFPSLDRFGNGRMIEQAFDSMAQGLLTKASDFVADTAAAMVSGAPSAVLFIIVTIVAAFYFACGYPALMRFVCARVPDNISDTFKKWSGTVKRTVGAYARCAVIMSGVSFVILSVGFLILGVENPILVAALCSAVDVLPVFGVGTVLVPWAVFRIVVGEYAVGFGIAIIYAVCTLVRQILEPKLMANSFGLHPAASLAAMYLGFRFFGFPGMIFLPVAASAAAANLRPAEQM